MWIELSANSKFKLTFMLLKLVLTSCVQNEEYGNCYDEKGLRCNSTNSGMASHPICCPDDWRETCKEADGGYRQTCGMANNLCLFTAVTTKYYQFLTPWLGLHAPGQLLPHAEKYSKLVQISGKVHSACKKIVQTATENHFPLPHHSNTRTWIKL